MMISLIGSHVFFRQARYAALSTNHTTTCRSISRTVNYEKGEPYGDLQLITDSLAVVAIATGWTEPRGSVYANARQVYSTVLGVGYFKTYYVVVLCRRRDELA